MSDIRLVESPWGVRWSSLAMLVVIVLAVVVVRRDRGHGFRLLLGGTAAMGWLVAFEIPYEATDILAHHRPGAHLTSWASWLLTVAGWPFAAYALGVRLRPRWRWVLLSAAIFALWVASGFQHNDPGQRVPVMWLPELLNEASKTALGIAYLLGAVAPDRLGRRLAGLSRRAGTPAPPTGRAERSAASR